MSHLLYFFIVKILLCQVADKAPFLLLTPTDSLPALIEHNERLTLISNRFLFTEGPAVDKAGNIFFTDQPNNSIWKYDNNGRLSLYLKPSGRSNGMYVDPHGNLVTCADEHNQLWSINQHKKKKILLDNFRGHQFNGPNDLWIDKKGGIYFTDPYYQRDYWKRKKPDMPGEYLYYLPKGNSVPLILDSTLRQPNGIVGTPDGKYLFVADIGDNKTYKYEIGPGGYVKNRELFIELGSDGITLDEMGNLYITGNGVTVFSPEGKQILHIDVPAKWTANLCFGGKDRRTLLITASESVYKIRMAVHGVE